MAMNKIDDRELVSLYINGSEKAFETLLVRHKDKIFRFIYMKVRDKALTQDIFQDTLKLDDENVEDEITRVELEEQMVELIEYLPDTQREILKMRIFKEMSFKDIADQKEISINTALGRMRYALINLRKLIEKHQLTVHY